MGSKLVKASVAAVAAIAIALAIWAYPSPGTDRLPIARAVPQSEAQHIRGGQTLCDEYGEYINGACTYEQGNGCQYVDGCDANSCAYACIKQPHWRFKAGSPKVTLKAGTPCNPRSHYRCNLVEGTIFNSCVCDAPIIQGACMANPLVKDEACAPGS